MSWGVLSILSLLLSLVNKLHCTLTFCLCYLQSRPSPIIYVMIKLSISNFIHCPLTVSIDEPTSQLGGLGAELRSPEKVTHELWDTLYVPTRV
jgi:hypothetical protein